ncbi:MAG TPA: hypothetical protein VF862_09270, partial [Gemmatimonadales bacterium]
RQTLLPSGMAADYAVDEARPDAAGNLLGLALLLAGIGATVFVLVALGAALAVTLRDGWRRIAVRVAGSWVAAIGLLLLGWGLRK